MCVCVSTGKQWYKDYTEEEILILTIQKQKGLSEDTVNNCVPTN